MIERHVCLALVLVIAALAGVPAGAAAGPRGIDPVTVHVFHRDAVHFDQDEPDRFAVSHVRTSDNGRRISRTVTLQPPEGPCEIVARVRIHPIPNDVNAVHDKWDRAGNVRLSAPDGNDVEIVKFITAYGGFTEHEENVTHLAPLLHGERTFHAWIDTWVSPAWLVDFELTFRPVEADSVPDWMAPWLDDAPRRAPDWATGVLYAEQVTREDLDAGDLVRELVVPEGTRRTELRVLSSGHCTDGSGADEFVSKDHVITVDGKEVHRYRPWRTDCRAFRDRNPYCRRWFDGSWSADYDRSGWCPGDRVEPLVLDLTEHLAPGRHELGFRVVDIRPRRGDHYGYWRLSAHAVGWTDASGGL